MRTRPCRDATASRDISSVAAHLRSAFPNDGEEVIDVVARHYIDALEAVPDDTDAGEIRELTIAALTRAAERAIRSGSQARAATCFCDAADLVDRTHTGDPRSAQLLERGADALIRADRSPAAFPIAGRAVERYAELGDLRSSARTRTMLGRSLRHLGRLAEARQNLIEALAVLRPEPDVDTVLALEVLGSIEMFDGSADADSVTAEAVALAQALDLGPRYLGRVFLTRGMHLDTIGHKAEAGMYMREAARLTEEIDAGTSTLAYLNLSNVLNVDDPAGAADAARQALDMVARSGEKFAEGTMVYNLSLSLVALGDWNDVEELLGRYVDDPTVDADEYMMCCRAWFAALRGDPDRADSMLGRLTHFVNSEDPQVIGLVSSTRAFVADTRNRPDDALAKAQLALEQVARALAFNGDDGRWVWPLAARSHMPSAIWRRSANCWQCVESHPIGHRAPMQRAEALLIEARLAAADHHEDAAVGLSSPSMHCAR